MTDVDISRQQARELLLDLERAERIVADCQTAMRTYRGDSRLRVTVVLPEGSPNPASMVVRAADLLPLAQWAVGNIRAQLRKAGYIVPGVSDVVEGS